MPLAIFDLDETLIAQDSDYLWGEFLIEEGLVNAKAYRAKSQLMYDAYLQGNYDVRQYIQHHLDPIVSLSPEEQASLQKNFTTSKVPPVIYKQAHKIIQKHRDRGDFCLIITATLSFISGPISQLFDVDAHIGTDTLMQNNGGVICEPSGVPSFQAGKVTRLLSWLEDKHYTLAGSHFYSDSHNDLPLLEAVEHPIAVNPDKRLREAALARNWPILSMT